MLVLVIVATVGASSFVVSYKKRLMETVKLGKNFQFRKNINYAQLRRFLEMETRLLKKFSKF